LTKYKSKPILKTILEEINKWQTQQKKKKTLARRQSRAISISGSAGCATQGRSLPQHPDFYF
jgi:hypothetical protein